MDEVIWVTEETPKYKELSLPKIFALIENEEEVLKHLPEWKAPPHKQPPQKYTLNVINTILPNFIDKLFLDAITAQRLSAQNCTNTSRSLSLRRNWNFLPRPTTKQVSSLSFTHLVL